MFCKKFTIALASLFLFACSDDDNNLVNVIPDPVGKAKVQVIHASQDAPPVNVNVNNITDLDFGEASTRFEVDEGTYSVSVDGITPDGDVTVIGPADLTFDADTIYSVYALNETASIEPVILSQPDMAPPAGQFTLQVLHAASNAPTVDIYLTAPSADISSINPTVTLAFKDSLSATDIDAGDYQIRITPTGDKTVVFDSGTVSLTEGAIINVAAITNTGPGDNPVNLLVTTDDGGALITDAGNAVNLRVFHLSPDAPAVDVVANDNFAMPLLSNVPFPVFSDYLTVPAADYNVKVVPTGQMMPAVIDADVTLDAATSYSVLAVGALANIEPLILIDNTRGIVTESQLRIIHASPSAGLVDLYLVAPATDISKVEPNFSGVDFKQDTGYLSIAAGDYDVVVTAQGSKTPAIGPAAIQVNAGGIYSIIARDNAGGGAPLGVVLADDF